MHLLVVGVSHRTASLELRERLDFSSRGLRSAVEGVIARPSADEAVVISTCNRAELYVACSDPAVAHEDLVSFFSDFQQLPADHIRSHLYSYVDEEAARHLFRVSAGLDSLVVGEPQILGQVKESFSVASAAQATGALLSKLFHWAFAVRRVLVVGTGEMGKLTATHLKSQGVGSVVITSRTLANAQELAVDVGGTPVAWDTLPHALLDADIVITATGASTPILSTAQVAQSMPPSRTRPLFIIDIAVPRDVEPSAGEIEQVFLYNIDDLQNIVRENLEKRGSEVGKAEQIVEDEVRKFTVWQRSRHAIPTVVALRQRFETIRQSELERLDAKLAGMPADVRSRVDEITRLIIEKLLLAPTEQLKSAGDAELLAQYTDALNRLFALSDKDKEPEA